MSKIISPVTPWLIQRCALEDGKFSYDYMGSSEFESDYQAKALKQLFRGKPTFSEVFVQANDGGATVAVYLIHQEGFDVRAYQPHLQALADNKLRLQESARFSDAVDQKATDNPPQFKRVIDYDIWFDFTGNDDRQNIVLFTLDEQKRANLLARLKVVTDNWASKKTP